MIYEIAPYIVREINTSTFHCEGIKFLNRCFLSFYFDFSQVSLKLKATIEGV